MPEDASIKVSSLLIKKGKIVDGSNCKPFFGDVLVENDIITSVGENIECDADRIIDAKGKIISPGFIDAHSHSDIVSARGELSDIKLQQGVTTEIFGNCGFSIAPVNKDTINSLSQYSAPFLGDFKDTIDWSDYKSYANMLGNKKYSHNVGGLVGSSTVRIAVKGFDSTKLSDEEIAKVRYHIKDALSNGALGVSIGLMYLPDFNYSADELTEIFKDISDKPILIACHIRGEGNSLLSSIEEVIELGKRSGNSIHISHFKAAGKNNWGTIDKAIQIIDSARAMGQDVTCDVYPYTAGSTTLSSIMPPSSMENGIEGFIEKANSDQRNEIVNQLKNNSDTWDNLVCTTGFDRVVILDVKSEKRKYAIGKSISEIACIEGKSNEDCAIDLLVEENGNVPIAFFHMSDEDVEKVIKLPYSFVISDSIYLSDGKPHPRLYGSFPRIFSKYVKEKKVISLETAVHKCSYMPAKRFSINRRGLIKQGYFADIVVFDQEKINDLAKYDNPRIKCEGIDTVIVNGHIAYEKAEKTEGNFGRLIKNV